MFACVAGCLSAYSPLAAAQASAAQPAARVIERVKAAVVAVGTYRRTRNPQFRFLGTGFAVGDGTLIATNAHVLPRALDTSTEPELLAILMPAQGGRPAAVREITRVSSDPDRDLALVKLKEGSLPALSLRQTDEAAEGDQLYFTGFPIGSVLGPFAATHRAMVAAITPIAIPPAKADQLDPRVIKRLQEGAFPIYQLDATVYPGNSGSPLYDPATGEVVGVINMVLVKEVKENALSQPSGISYAIPVLYLRRLLAAVK